MSKTRRNALAQAIESAVTHLEAGSLADAERTLHRMEVSPAEAPGVVYFHATILMALERWTQAMSRLNAIDSVLPGQSKVQFDRATCLVCMGRHDDARAMLEADDTLRGHSLAYVLLARIAAREGNLADSARLLREACRSDRVTASAVLDRPRLNMIVEGWFHPGTEEEQAQGGRRVH